MRLKYTKAVDVWSLGCILAELYTGYPLFPGENEREQLELIMELKGAPPTHVIDQSRKKDLYFFADYEPKLEEDEKFGILRIPESRTLQEAIESCQDPLFLDFIDQCLNLDPKERVTPDQALQHPWIQAGLPQTPSNEQNS